MKQLTHNSQATVHSAVWVGHTSKTSKEQTSCLIVYVEALKLHTKLLEDLHQIDKLCVIYIIHNRTILNHSFSVTRVVAIKRKSAQDLRKRHGDGS